MLDQSALEAVMAAADQILGDQHPIARALRVPMLDAAALHAIYEAIEALPEHQRRLLGGVAAAYMGVEAHAHCLH